ncbi:MAG: hypothetical protein LBJ32_04380 [Oscillospiraceae bacterium]|jgi:D-alanyl-D-alanine carboxypeptidase (penicillin-binding protein 5/6)|nr:hypothetical protein [Oscillospiraceae bacterium]
MFIKVKKLFLILYLFLFLVSNVFCFIEKEFKTESFLLINKETNSVVFKKNSDVKRSPASLTKIMTYIIVTENVKNPNEQIVHVKESVLETLKDTNCSTSGLLPGEEISVSNLLERLMICSCSYSALVLANEIGSGVDNFIDMMNKKAKDLKCENTKFKNPHGLYDSRHFTTCEDLYKITRHAMDDPNFTKIVQKKEVPIGQSFLPTTNKLMQPTSQYFYDCVNGIKTGYHDEAGYCIITSAENSGLNYVCIAMGAPSLDENGEKIQENYAMLESRDLLRWAFKNLKIHQFYTPESILGVVNAKIFSKKSKKLPIGVQESIKAAIPNELKSSEIETKLEISENLTSPINYNEVIGHAYLKYKEQKLVEFPIVAKKNIKRNFWNSYSYLFQMTFKI